MLNTGAPLLDSDNFEAIACRPKQLYLLNFQLSREIA